MAVSVLKSSTMTFLYHILPVSEPVFFYDEHYQKPFKSLNGSLSKNGGIQKDKIIKKYCPKFHFFWNSFINTNMEKIYGKYAQFKNMYNVSVVN